MTKPKLASERPAAPLADVPASELPHIEGGALASLGALSLHAGDAALGAPPTPGTPHGIIAILIG